MFLKILLMILGFIFLIKGADFVVKAARNIALKFHLSEILIGIVIVGIGTSLPEIIVTMQSTLTGNQDIIIGNSIGSCICNLLLVIGIASVCSPIRLDDKFLKVHLPVSIFTILMLVIFCNFGDYYTINRLEAVLLIFFAIIYVIYTIYDGKEQTEEEKEESSMISTIIYLILGIFGLKYGADFVVNGAVYVAEFLGVSESIISMTVVAFGTSLPEIVTCIIATIKKESDLAIGNVIGSNIFNICLLPGIGALISPIEYDLSFNKSVIFLLMITTYLLVFDLFQNKREISRNHGIVFILVFLLYVSCLF